MTPALALVGGLVLVACRGDVGPFEAPPRPADPTAELRPLTFNIGDDRSPVWSANGDTIYYSAEGFAPLPNEPGVLVALPHTGGVVREILRNVEDALRPGLAIPRVTPALAHDGETLAYVQVGPPWIDPPCSFAELMCTPDREVAPLPPIRLVIYRVRPIDAVGPESADPALVVPMPDASLEFVGAGTPVYDVRFGPAQRLYDTERSLFFRPSWDPAGGRIVFGDGGGLWLWRVDESEAARLPNTTNGTSPAWSPDGEWIAYTRIESADSASFSCQYIQSGNPMPCAILDYEEHEPGARTLGLVRPDGSESVDLGPGEDPAWSSDGSWIYFRRDDAVWRIRPDGSEAAAVPRTRGGRDPAVSPDGRRLAFARRTPRGDHDLWVLDLGS